MEMIKEDNRTNWIGEKNRSKAVQRVCNCGTCQADAKLGAVGFLSWSDEDGNGVTEWISSEQEYKTLKEEFGEVYVWRTSSGA